MWWQLGALANGTISIAYFLISAAILFPLVRERQLWTNKLGTATAMIFFSCAVHHGTHAVHLVLPAFGMDEQAGLSLRDAFSFHVVAWDVVSAFVAIWYWSLRRVYGQLMQGAKLFEDLRERERRALQINDDIVQGLTVAKMALELDQRDKSVEALEGALAAASGIITDLLGTGDGKITAGHLVRDEPAAARPAVP